jgi:hypothetical protein
VCNLRKHFKSLCLKPGLMRPNVENCDAHDCHPKDHTSGRPKAERLSSILDSTSKKKALFNIDAEQRIQQVHFAAMRCQTSHALAKCEMKHKTAPPKSFAPESADHDLEERHRQRHNVERHAHSHVPRARTVEGQSVVWI